MLRSANSELTPFYGMTLSHGVENITHDDTEINEKRDALKLKLTQSFNRFFLVLWFVLNSLFEFFQLLEVSVALADHDR